MPTPQPVVLVVDDEEDIRTTVASYLESALPWVRVLCAGSGADALRALDAEPVALVVSDYRMPGMDGLQLLVEVRRRRPAVHRVLMTAYPDAHVAVRALNEAHVEQFLTKPLEPEALHALVAGLFPPPAAAPAS